MRRQPSNSRGKSWHLARADADSDEWDAEPRPPPELNAPAPSKGGRRGGSLDRLRLILLALYIAALSALAVWTAERVFDEREEATLRTRQRATDLARALEPHIARTFGETDVVLTSLAETLRQRGHLRDIDPADLHGLARTRFHSLPQLAAIAVVDGAGKTLTHTKEYPLKGSDGQPWVIPPGPAAENMAEPTIGHAVRDPVSQRLVVPVIKKIEAGAGDVEGAIVGGIDPAYFEQTFRGLLPDGTTLLILHRDGHVLVKHPGAERADQPDPPVVSLFQNEPGNAGAATLARGLFSDSVPAVAAFKRLTPLPLTVVVAIPVDAGLAPWRDQALVIAAGAALVALLVGLILLAVYIEARRRSESADALRQSNESLEAQLRQRSESVERLNAQLSAFSYSISHDLRGPLRAINGFCQAIDEDYGDRLEPNGRDYLKRVRRASERMGEFIDRLVELTSLSRSTVRRSDIDLSEYVRRIAADLTRREPDRNALFDIGPDVRGDADPGLTRLLLVQLLDNAWKFTRTTKQPRISFGAIEEAGETVYFVDDNGIGFDMSHAGKLFEPFQRLHAEADYEGSGIGLATVKRIVELHCGRVWVDAVAGRGVSVFFTLSPARPNLSTSAAVVALR